MSGALFGEVVVGRCTSRTQVSNINDDVNWLKWQIKLEAPLCLFIRVYYYVYDVRREHFQEDMRVNLFCSIRVSMFLQM